MGTVVEIRDSARPELQGGRLPRECFFWASIGGGCVSQSTRGAVRAEEVKLPFGEVPLATALQPGREGFKAADLRPRSSPVDFH